MMEPEDTKEGGKGFQSSYERFRANNLKSYVRRDPFKVMMGLFGTRYALYRKRWAQAYNGSRATKTFPLHIDVDLQDACNLRCFMCHQRYRKRTGNVICRETLTKIIDEGSASGLCAINIGASGEPLLHKDLLIYAVEYACKKGIMDIFVHTNAVLLDDQIGSRLIDSGLKHLCISIDAFTPETYQRTRNSNCFESVVENVFRFRKLKEERMADFPTIRLSFCVNPLNWHEKDAFVNYWKNEVDLVELQSYRHVDASIQLSDSFRRYRPWCANPFRRLMVWPNGDVSLCCGYRSSDVTLGNISGNPGVGISSLWTSPKINRIAEAFSGQAPLPETCSTCLDSSYKAGE